MRTIILAAMLTFFFGFAAQPCVARAADPLENLFAAKDWVNGKPTRDSLRGKVVLVDVYTFGCINCKNVQPNLRKLYRTISRSDLVIVSVHSPETAFERSRNALIASTKLQGVAWPVAVDNDFRIWNLFGITAWPTQLIYDRSGRLRQTVVGDSQDAVVDATVNQLISAR